MLLLHVAVLGVSGSTIVKVLVDSGVSGVLSACLSRGSRCEGRRQDWFPRCGVAMQLCTCVSSCLSGECFFHVRQFRLPARPLLYWKFIGRSGHLHPCAVFRSSLVRDRIVAVFMFVQVGEAMRHMT